MGQKTEFTFELEETYTLKQGGKIVPGYCPKCEIEVEMVSPDVLALAVGASEREIFRLVEAGKVYFQESDRLIVCPICYRTSTAHTAG